jgi:hypothetical protein
MRILVRRINQSLFGVGDDARQTIKGLPSGDIEIEYGSSSKRTGKQNNSLHEFFENIANACNDSGQEMEVSSPMLSKTITVRWTKDSVKEYIWRPVQKAMFPNTHSTADLTTTELMRVTEQLQHFLVTRFTINVEFPSVESKRHLDGVKERF